MKKLCVARPKIGRWILNSLTYFDGVGAAGTGADAGAAGVGTAGADGFDVFENCCNTELPTDATVEF